ncbi:Gfo/Idh/MocA family protein [Cohnella nanjingensis]|uniref:Gfo/Idh/MocA family oxidoreductase n=1 Tax=Cohnella nanjingensis TaxID=1387779 RepID=A0A7X0VJH7_9BACL|nr:Gfo/Idh/MocA family oxidoreductase [Cohnella nanjingensis]MBB6674724.1 Gfo/Idh/MocA family oxidoreductase [Cohnella nanjingensis]
MRKLRIGFVGVGGMGQMAHLSNYAALRETCEVVALAEVRPQTARLVAERYGVPQVFDDHRALLEGVQVDAIVAPQPYRAHHAIIPDILRAGIPVFTEKPLSLTVGTGEELVRLAEANGTLHMVGYHKRSDPAMAYAHERIGQWKASGEYGKLQYIRVTMPPGDWIGGADAPLSAGEPYPVVLQEAGPADFTDEQTQRLDIFVNYYIHQINAIRFLLQEPYRIAFADRSGVLLTGESDSGVTVALEMAPYQTTVEWHESLLVCFERGYIRVDLPSPLARQQAGKVTIMKDNGKYAPSYELPVMPNRSAMRQQAMNFIAAVQGVRPAPCESREALEDLKLARDYIRLMQRYS